jgi:hypothetical protein
MSKPALETKREMVLDYLRKTDNSLAIERVFDLFIAPELRHMLFGGTPGHDAKGNPLER